jgi:hypothetical protein
MEAAASSSLLANTRKDIRFTRLAYQRSASFMVTKARTMDTSGALVAEGRE